MLTWDHHASEAPRPMSTPFPSILRPRPGRGRCGKPRRARRAGRLRLRFGLGTPLLHLRQGRRPRHLLRDREGRGRDHLTDSPDDEFAPVVSPDGRLIAFLTGSEPDVSIHTMRTDGTSRTQVTTGRGSHGSQRWSPESDRLAYVVRGSGSLGVYTSAADGGGAVLLTSLQGEEVGDWSRNGNTVVFAVLGGEEPASTPATRTASTSSG